MEEITFIYHGDYDMSHMIDDFEAQLKLSKINEDFGTRKFIEGEVYRVSSEDSDWKAFGFPFRLNGNFGRYGKFIYTGICVREKHIAEIELYAKGPKFITIR
jgi:hypothetical protein